MVNEEKEKEIKMEKIWKLIKIVWKQNHKAKVREICQRICISAEGALYTRNDILECIAYFEEKGFLKVNEDGSINETVNEEKNDETKKFKEELKCLTANLKKDKEREEENKAKENKVIGYHSSRKNDNRGGRFH